MHGLGWTVLLLALTSALLPYLAQSLDAQMRRSLRWFALGAGGIVLLYLVSHDLRLVRLGLVITTVGYACQAIGLWQEEQAVSRVPSGVQMRA